MTAACWAVALAAALTLAARGFRGAAWELDQFATFIAPVAAACLVAGAMVFGAGRRVAGVLILAIAVAHGAWMAQARAPVRGGPAERTVRALTFNYNGLNPDPRPFLDELRATDADVVTVLEVPTSLVRAIRDDPTLAVRYPHRSMPAPGSWWNRVKLSRWPLEPVLVGDPGEPAERSSYVLWKTDLVRHPASPFLLTTMLPLSPRTPSDWTVGNAQAEQAAAWARERLAPLGYPVVVAADLNASPTGVRTALVARAGGLRRAKPPTVLAGTWPSNWRAMARAGVEGAPVSPSTLARVWPSRLDALARVAIDDLLVSKGVGVASWAAIEADTGSDHTPVVATIVLPERP